MDKWNKRYRNADIDFNTQPDSELIEYAHYLKGGGLALDVACGSGKNAVYLATLGYDVVALDGSIEGLKQAVRRSDHKQVKINPVVYDLKACCIPENCFSLIVVVRYLQRSLFDSLIRGLTSDGLIFYKTFNTNHLRNKASFNNDFVVSEGELQNSFAKLNIVEANPGTNSSSSFILAQKTA